MNNKKRLVSDSRMEEWNSLPKEMKVRQLKGSDEFFLQDTGPAYPSPYPKGATGQEFGGNGWD